MEFPSASPRTFPPSSEHARNGNEYAAPRAHAAAAPAPTPPPLAMEFSTARQIGNVLPIERCRQARSVASRAIESDAAKFPRRLTSVSDFSPSRKRSADPAPDQRLPSDPAHANSPRSPAIRARAIPAPRDKQTSRFLPGSDPQHTPAGNATILQPVS